jgi:hypothetical protein
MTTLHPTFRLLALGGALLASAAGCQLDLDADLVKDSPEGDGDADAGEVQCPLGFTCAPDVPEMDGSSGSFEDSGQGWSGDSGSPDSGSPGVACTEDNQCALDAFCSATGYCAPACDEAYGCVVAGSRGVVNLLAEGEAVYWSSEGSQDELGNHLRDGAIWRLWPDGSSTAQITGLAPANVTAVIDGVFYFALNGQFVRAAINGQPEQVGSDSDSLGQVTASASYLWFAGPWEFDGTDFYTDVWRAPRPSGKPIEKLKDVLGSSLVAATDSSLAMGINQDHGVLLHDLVGGSVTNVFGGTSGGSLTEDRLISWSSIGAFNTPLDAGSFLSLVPKEQEGLYRLGLSTALWGEWLIWGGFEEERSQPERGTFVLGRTHVGLSMPHEVLAEIPANQNLASAVLASPWADEVIYIHPAEQRLFRLSIPPFSCASSIPCPPGYGCQPDQTCRRLD